MLEAPVYYISRVEVGGSYSIGKRKCPRASNYGQLLLQPCQHGGSWTRMLRRIQGAAKMPRLVRILQTNSSQTNILRAEFPGELPTLLGEFHPLKYDPARVRPIKNQDVNTREPENHYHKRTTTTCSC